MDKVDGLIEVLLDNTARIDERDDAAMDLARYNDDRALAALIKAANNPDEDNTVLESIGESIATIWIERKEISNVIFDKLPAKVKSSIRDIIKVNKPEWVDLL